MLLDRSERLIEGAVVLRCRQCRTFRLDGDSKTFSPVGDLIGQLRRRQIQLDEAKVDKELIESDITDPRWTQIDG
jgi:hypothetical protein